MTSLQETSETIKLVKGEEAHEDFSLRPPSPAPVQRRSASSPLIQPIEPTSPITEMSHVFDVNERRIDMEQFMLLLWRNRKNQQFILELCQRLSCFVMTKPILDQAEFFLPQLAHMVVHLDKELPIEAMEQFVFLLSQSSVHFALHFFWIIYASLDENRPKRHGNPATFARCAQLLLALEQCLIYGSPIAREASHLLTRKSISHFEMEQILTADRRFFAAQYSPGHCDTEDDIVEGWLLKKGGGTRKVGRRSWNLRWCRIEQRILVIYDKPSDTQARTAISLDLAEIRIIENAKHPFYFEILHNLSETIFHFAAQNKADMKWWTEHLHVAAAAPAPPRNSPRPVKAISEKALSRMSSAMRTFILQTTEDDDDDTQASHLSSSQSSQGNPTCSLPKTQDSSSDDDTFQVAQESEEAQTFPFPSYQRRYEFFAKFINFIKGITDVSESLRRLDPLKRKTQLSTLLKKISVPTKAYIPLCKSTDERAPCLIYFDTEVDKNRGDVSTSLFDYLYEEENDSEREKSSEQAHQPSDLSSIRLNNVSPLLEILLKNENYYKDLESVFGELSYTVRKRLRKHSVVQDAERWHLMGLIAKSYDDLRQEVLVMQLISYFQVIFDLEGLPLWLHPYKILSTGANTGLIQVVQNAISLDALKKKEGFRNLRTHFESMYGHMKASHFPGDGDQADDTILHQAQLNFIHSLAAYSLVCYALCIKDRHNGNIMVDVEGHLIHIDFGYFLGRAPGGNFSFETAPFKLTAEMVDVFGGRQSSNYKYFCDLCVKGALTMRKHAEVIYTLVEVMSFHSKLPCFAANVSLVLTSFRERLFLSTPAEKIESLILQMIEKSYDHFGTTKYDQFQVLSNGIAK
uniref:1-phosphatidylinositol 4-kinase n=1 Tax=Albugo laibachii Nc14 TaxID=890382 RepID=F0WLV9_9STRA|nr:phosphatidylinositol kinase (PIKH1) putative [Albugo laibachii Nc14]|eukprot:CCA22285.1 phosphatidylinositol kinase (PIKH1) putative [Albugo laibachii Nc14]